MQARLMPRASFGCDQIAPTRVRGEYTVTCEVGTTYHTGVEMEALTGASVAALCVYDMCKALSHEIVIKDTRLLVKQGGKRSVDVRGSDAV